MTRFFSALVFTLFLGAVCPAGLHGAVPPAKHPVIDASYWDDHVVYPLADAWMTAAEWTAFEPSRPPAGVPLSVWTNGSTRKGVLRLTLEAGRPYTTLEYPEWYPPFQLWINGEMVVTNRLDTGAITSRKNPDHTLLTRMTNDFEIVFVSAKPHFRSAQPWKEIRFGRRLYNLSARNTDLLLESAILGIFLFIFLINLARAFIYRGSSLSYLVLSVLSLAYAWVTFFSGRTTFLLAGFDWRIVFRLLVVLYNLSLSLWIIHEFLTDRRKPSRQILFGFLAVSLGGCAASLAIPSAVLPAFQSYYFAFYGLALVAVTAIGRWGLSDVPGLLVRAVSVTALVAAVVIDTVRFGNFQLYSITLPLGSLVLLIAFTLRIAFHLHDEIQHAGSLAKQVEILEREWNALRARQEADRKQESSLLAIQENVRKQKDEFRSRFTPREREILDRLIRGDSYKEISESLFVSEKTVDNHAQNIYRKAGVRGRGHLQKMMLRLESREG